VSTPPGVFKKNKKGGKNEKKKRLALVVVVAYTNAQVATRKARFGGHFFLSYYI
jgi:hypothetical protein